MKKSETFSNFEIFKFGVGNWKLVHSSTLRIQKIDQHGFSKFLSFFVDFLWKTDFSMIFEPPKSLKNQFFIENRQKNSNFSKNHANVFFVSARRYCVPIFSSQLLKWKFQIFENFFVTAGILTAAGGTAAAEPPWKDPASAGDRGCDRTRQHKAPI